MNLEYSRWNKALAQTFFPTDVASTTAYLAVDDDVVEEIGRTYGISDDNAAASLALAVRGELGHENQRFKPFTSVIDTWRDVHEIPPQIGLLSLFVLAASRMDVDPEHSLHANDYYSRLNPLLSLKVTAGMPEGFDALGVLWHDLKSWLDDDLNGARGLSSIQTHPHFTHIGFPLSQCALRSRDRHRLPDFFRSVQLEPGDELSDDRLLVHLRAWAHRPACGLSSIGRASILSPPEGMRAKAVVAIAQRELASWNGELRDAEGRRRAELLLIVEVRKRTVRKIRLFATCPDGFPEGATWTTSEGETLVLTSTGNGWYGDIPVKNPKAVLNKGLTLSCGKFALSYDAAALVPLILSFNPVSHWVSQRRITMFRGHLLLVNSALAPVAETFLTAYAERGVAKEDLAPLGLSGWHAYFNVELKHMPSSNPPEGLELLVPHLNTTTKLEGGLRPARSIYLTGGEPDVLVTASEGDPCEVTIDGATNSAAAQFNKFRLSETALAPGFHVIRAGGRTIQFTSIDSLGDITPPKAGGLAHHLERHSDYKPEGVIATEARTSGPGRGEVAICGAHVAAAPEDLPSTVRPPVALPAQFARYVVIGSQPGEVDAFGSPGRPAWLAEELQFQFFEREFAFSPQFVILTGKAGKVVRAVSLSPSSPGVPTGAPHEIKAWADAIQLASAKKAQVAPGAEALWSLYLARATEITQAPSP